MRTRLQSLVTSGIPLLVSAALGSRAAAVPVLVLTKFSPAPVISSGDTATFDVLVQNAGDATASVVTLTDALPPTLTWSTATSGCSVNGATQVLSCSLGSLPPSGAVLVSASAPTAGAPCGLYTNTATAGSANANNPTSNPASIQVNCPSLAVSMSSDVFRAIGGEPLGFRIAVSNDGTGTARGVTASGALPSGLPWTVSPAVSGCSVDVTGQLGCAFQDLGPGQARAVHVRATTPPDTCGHMQASVSASSTNGSNAGAFRNVTFAPSGDVDGSCDVAVGDVFYLINFLFAGGPSPQ
jgi:uncharacterized repeat protein (TIGR01451 family)